MTVGGLIYELMSIKEQHGGNVPVHALGEYDSHHDKVDEVFYREEGAVIISHRRFDEEYFNKEEVEI